MFNSMSDIHKLFSRTLKQQILRTSVTKKVQRTENPEDYGRGNVGDLF